MKTLRGSLQCYKKKKKLILKVMLALVIFIEECLQSLSLTVTKYPELMLTSLTAWVAPGAGFMQPNRKESWDCLTTKMFPASCSHKCRVLQQQLNISQVITQRMRMSCMCIPVYLVTCCYYY